MLPLWAHAAAIAMFISIPVASHGLFRNQTRRARARRFGRAVFFICAASLIAAQFSLFELI